MPSGITNVVVVVVVVGGVEVVLGTVLVTVVPVVLSVVTGAATSGGSPEQAPVSITTATSGPATRLPLRTSLILPNSGPRYHPLVAGSFREDANGCTCPRDGFVPRYPADIGSVADMISGQYRSTQARITELVADTDVSVAVPACPGWTILQLVAHLTGIARDVTEGNLVGYGGRSWTNIQIACRDGASIDDLLVEWHDVTDPLARILDDPELSNLPDPFETAILGSQPLATLPGAVLGDIVIHEHDIRGALGDTNARTSPELVATLDAMIRTMRRGFPGAGLPTLRVVAEDVGLEWLMGLDAPKAEVRASAYELFRSIAGRRTREEMAALHWEGDAHRFLDHLVISFFSRPACSLRER